MTRRASVLLLALVLALLAPDLAHASPLVVPPPVEVGEPSAAARRAGEAAYKRAQRYFRRGKLELALEEAKNTLRALPRASSAFVVATILEELDRPREAFEHLLVAWELGPVEAQRPAIEEAFTRVGAGASPQLCWARLEVAPPGARVTVDGAAAPVGRVFGVEAGAREIAISAPGHLTQTHRVELAPGPLAQLSYTLEPAPPEPPEPEPVAPAPDPEPVIAVVEPAEPESPTAGWVLVGTGAALAVAGGALVGLAHAEADAANGCRQPGGGATDEVRLRCYEDASDRAELFQIAGWASAATGLVVGLTGVILVAGAGDEAVGAGPGPGDVGVSFSGRF